MPDVHNLGTAGEVAAKTREGYVRHTLAILVKEIIASDEAPVRVVVHPTAGLVIREPGRRGIRRKLSLSAIRRRNELQQILGRHGKRRLRNLGAGEYASGRRVTACAIGAVRRSGSWINGCCGEVIRFAGVHRVPQTSAKLGSPVVSLHQGSNGVIGGINTRSEGASQC